MLNPQVEQPDCCLFFGEQLQVLSTLFSPLKSIFIEKENAKNKRIIKASIVIFNIKFSQDYYILNDLRVYEELPINYLLK